MKILIAEDEHDILARYRIALQRKGHEVVATANGEECLEVYAEERRKWTLPFDASSTDCMLSGSLFPVWLMWSSR